MDMTTWLGTVPDTVPDKRRRRRKKKRKKLTPEQSHNRGSLRKAINYRRKDPRWVASQLTHFGRCLVCVEPLGDPDGFSYRFGLMPSDIVNVRIWKCDACGARLDERLLSTHPAYHNYYDEPLDIGDKPIGVHPDPGVLNFLRITRMMKAATDTKVVISAWDQGFQKAWEELECPIKFASRFDIDDDEIEVIRDWLLERGLYNGWDVR